MKKLFFALWIEIKHSIFKSFFYTLRFGGLLIIPLIYGFSYIFAFYDPFKHTEKLPLAVVTVKHKTNGLAGSFEKTLGKELGKTDVLRTGDLKMNIKMSHVEMPEDIYNDAKKQKDWLHNTNKKYYATIFLPKVKPQIETHLTTLITDIVQSKKTNLLGNINTLIQDLKKKDLNRILINNNYKKNYLISFGIDIGSSMLGGGEFMAKKIANTLTNPEFIKQLKSGSTPLIKNAAEEQTYNDAIKQFSDIVNQKNHFEPIHLEPQMGDKAMYGYGLAPFFISVAMWIGGMVMTFAVHKKIYEKETMPGIRYLAKWILIMFGTIIQATLLIGSLYFIGFDKLGPIHIWSLYGFTIFVGIVFSAIIQAIRFLIPNRNVGIFVTIILLVLQMASAGGLFPIETQSSFYQTIHHFLPMSRSVDLFREVSYATNWTKVMHDLLYLFAFLGIVPFAIYAYHHQTIRFYEIKGWKLPEKILIRREKHRSRLEKRKRRYGGDDA